MENSLQKLNEIMKPYFDIKQEIESNEIDIKKEQEESKETILEYDEKIISRKKLLKRARMMRKKQLEDELSDLIINTNKKISDLERKKESIINDKVSNTINNDSNLFIGYGTVLRKDIEKSLGKEYDNLISKTKENYKLEEKILLNQIKVLSSRNDKKDLELSQLMDEKNKLELNLKNLVPEKDSRQEEFAKVKFSVNKNLSLYKNELEVELNRDKEIFEKLNNGLNNFKFEYDSEGKIINGDSRIEILKQINNIKEEIEKLETAIKRVDEYLEITKTDEEEKVSIMLSNDEPTKKNDYSYKEIEFLGNLDNDISDEGFYVSDVEKYNNEITVDSKRELIKFIYRDILNEIDGIDAIYLNEDSVANNYSVSTKSKLDKEEVVSSEKLDLKDKNIDLPSGEYVSLNNLGDAIYRYYAKNKDLVYVTGDNFKKYKITTHSINYLKDKLRNCSAIKLIGFQTILKVKVSKMYGKEKDFKEYNKDMLGKAIGIANIKPGEYINKYELLTKLDSLFSKKFQLVDDLKDMFKQENNDNQTYVKTK